MAIRALLEHNPNRLRFEEFPTAFVNYQEEIPRDELSPEFVPLQTLDIQTEKIQFVFLKLVDLRRVGISITAWNMVSHQPQELSQLIRNTSTTAFALQQSIPSISKYLSSKRLEFFLDTPFVNRIINKALCNNIQHVSPEEKEVPEMYIDYSQPLKVFIDLKEAPSLGEGGYSEVKRVLWLNAVDKKDKIVAKKTFTNTRSSSQEHFQRELTALQKFHGKNGIIQLISGGNYDDTPAIFLPAYECNLGQYFQEYPFPLSDDDWFCLIAHWLEGLAIISEEGIHGDIKLENLLLKRTRKGVQGVIADFGSYNFYKEKKKIRLMTTSVSKPPEYSMKKLTNEFDLWGAGLCLFEIFSQVKKGLPCWNLDTKEERERWLSTLTPGWILKYQFKPATPPFILPIINQMLDPRPDHRLTAKAAFDRFSEGLASFRERSQKSAAPEEVKA